MRASLFFLAILLSAMAGDTRAASEAVYLPMVANKPSATPIPRDDITANLGAQIEDPISNFKSWSAVSKAPNAFVKLSVRWAQVERVRGVYAWPTDLDELVARIGDRPLLIGIKGTPPWARHSAWQDLECKPPVSAYDDDYGRFVVQVIKRYPNTVMVELWNEPENRNSTPNQRYAGCDWSQKRYADLLKVAYPIIKRAAPNVQVLAGASVQVLSWVDGFPGYTDKFDVLSFHAYGQWTPTSGMLTDWAASVIEVAHAWAGDKPLALTETGLLCYLGCEDSRFEDDKVSYLHWLMNEYGDQIETIVWYSFGDTEWRRTALAYDNQRLPAWYTFRDYSEVSD